MSLDLLDELIRKKYLLLGEVSDIETKILKVADSLQKKGMIPFCQKCKSDKGVVTNSGDFYCFHCGEKHARARWTQ